MNLWAHNRPMAVQTPTIVGLGEALFDLFPDGPRLGGAPLNVAVHAHQLGSIGVVVSRIGQDDYAPAVLEELRRRGLTTDYIQRDPKRPTGTVRVELDKRGEPTFTITADVAWDFLEFDGKTEDLARRCQAVCFGSLAQRHPQSRASIQQFLEAARSAGSGVRLFDVNLRQQFFDRPTLKRSCELASAMKINTSELQMLGELLGLATEQEKAARLLIQRFELEWLALTRGPLGTVVYTPDERHEGEPVRAKEGGDAVGAGDSAAAALLHGAIRHWPWERTIGLANALGAYVASQPGACPPPDPQIVHLAG